MDIVERLDAAIKTEDFWVGDQREDNILKDSKKIIEQLREALFDIANIINPQYYGAEMQEIAREVLKGKE
jgi:hypothetical protein